MNERDSETLTGVLDEMGYSRSDNKEGADLIFFNTCCVRDNAERRVFGNVEWLRARKLQNPDLLIAVCGCMMQQPHLAQRFAKKYSFVDLIFGTNQFHLLVELMDRVFFEKTQLKPQPVLSVDEDNTVYEHLPTRRSNEFSAYVNIMYGCNNFCSYCIVPYVRGRERSRRPDDILSEVRTLVLSGVKEVTLLGQNVNSYDNELSFPKLLRGVAQTGIDRVRFMTSHPKDLSDDLISVMASTHNVCGHLHLPVQSGSDGILSEMNRNYTAKHYLDLVCKLRSAIPHIGITTDIIVGFPGETEEDFLNTLALAEAARFDAAFTFMYSPREGTPAASLMNQVPDEVKRERIQTLISIQEKITREIYFSLIGSSQRVLTLGSNKRGDGLSGRCDRGITVNFEGKPSEVGHIVDVCITKAGHNTLTGKLSGNSDMSGEG